MKTIRNVAIGLSISVQSITCFAQSAELNRHIKFPMNTKDSRMISKWQRTNNSPLNKELTFDFEKVNDLHSIENSLPKKFRLGGQKRNSTLRTENNPAGSNKAFSRFKLPGSSSNQSRVNIGLLSEEKEPFFKNRRNIYSSLWAFASLNYLYADLVGIMDKNKLIQYQTGVVEGVRITPEFLTIAASFMQIPLVNVFLPQVIKNEKTLRWVQIASGTIMTLVQASTLFVGKPTPYYLLFSACEIAATTYITIDAIRWKPNSNKKKVMSDYQ
jgi:hypothetical protein